MRRLLACLITVTFTACATGRVVAVPPAAPDMPQCKPEEMVAPLRAPAPAPFDGVLLSTDCAALHTGRMAAARSCCQSCLAELSARDRAVEPWLVVVLALAAGSAGAVGGYYLSR